MEGGYYPHAASARMLLRSGRVFLVFVLLLGLITAVSGPARAEDLSVATRALFEAVERNDFSAVQSTVADGARIEARDRFGMRPVDVAIDRGHYQIAHYLLSLHNANPPLDDTKLAAEPPDIPSEASAVLPSPPSSAEPSLPRAPATAALPPASDATAPVARAPDETSPPPSIPVDAGPDPSPAVTAFDEALDTFLGGWFFKWMSQKIGRSDPPRTGTGDVQAAELEMPGTEPLPPPPFSADPSSPAPDIAPIPSPGGRTTAGEEMASLPAAPASEPPAPTAGAMTPAEPSEALMPTSPQDTPLAAIDPEAPADAPRATADAADAADSAAEPPAEVAPPIPTPSPIPPLASLEATSVPAPAGPEPSLPAVSALDPFAPDAVAPGARHPIIGDRPPAISVPVASPPPSPKSSAAAIPRAKLKPAPRRPPAPPSRAERPTTDGPAATLDRLAALPEAAPPPKETAAGPLGLEGPADAIPIAPVRTAALSPTPILRPADAVLAVGDSIHLSAPMPPEPDDPGERNFCVTKNRGATTFCVEPVDWPARLAAQLKVSSIMYHGAQAIVRYDDGLTTHVHAIFPTASHAALVAHHSQRLGKPTQTDERIITPFAQPRQPNPVVSWQRTDPLSGRTTTLEIRKYDDTRGGFPDMRYGALMLYNTDSPPIFPVLSALDLIPTAASR